ncbi:hypothetical protein D9M69_349060 [compost metagenome]
MDARVQQRAAQTVIVGAADERGRIGLDVAAVAVDVGRDRGVGREGLRDRPRREVDDAAHVLRAVAHRTRAAHHVDALQVAQRQRCHRQLRLAIGRHRQRHAVHQDGRARRQARSQAAHAHVERHIAAAGAVVLLHLHARDAAQHLAHVVGAGFPEGLAVDDGAGAGVLQHLGFIGVVEPVADHGDGVEGGFCAGAAGGGSRGGGLGVGGEGEQQGGADGTGGEAESGLQDEGPGRAAQSTGGCAEWGGIIGASDSQMRLVRSNSRAFVASMHHD